MELRWGELAVTILFIATNPSSTRADSRFDINFGGQRGLGWRLAAALRVGAL
jgi:hypothetical protein